jgi:hypothetical protein
MGQVIKIDSHGKVSQIMSKLFELGLMVNLYLNLNKGSLILETVESRFCLFSPFVEDSTRYMKKCGGDLPSLSATYTLEISHTSFAQHRLRFHDKGQGKLE